MLLTTSDCPSWSTERKGAILRQKAAFELSRREKGPWYRAKRDQMRLLKRMALHSEGKTGSIAGRVQPQGDCWKGGEKKGLPSCPQD